jgi:hypothetical protein
MIIAVIKIITEFGAIKYIEGTISVRVQRLFNGSQYRDYIASDARTIREPEAHGGMRTGRGSRSTRSKPTSVTLRLP